MIRIIRRIRPFIAGGLFVLSLAAAAAPSRVIAAEGDPPPPSEADATKELRFKFAAKVQRESRKDEVSSRMALDFGETGSIILGQTEIRLSPVKFGEGREMHFEVRDLDSGKSVHRSVVPIIDAEGLKLHAEIDPTQSPIRIVLVELARY